MRDLLEGLERCSAHTLSGGVQRNKIRELRLQSDQFLVKPVVLAIANYRRSFVVIEAVVLPNLVSQLLETLCSLASSLAMKHDTNAQNLGNHRAIMQTVGRAVLCTPFCLQ